MDATFISSVSSTWSIVSGREPEASAESGDVFVGVESGKACRVYARAGGIGGVLFTVLHAELFSIRKLGFEEERFGETYRCNHR